MKSLSYLEGFTDALCHISDIFELHSDALMKKHILRKKDTAFIVSVIDAALCRREVLSEVGAKGMNLYISKDKKRVALKEK